MYDSWKELSYFTIFKLYCVVFLSVEVIL